MKYLSVHEVQMAYDLLVGMNPQIINDAQEFDDLLVGMNPQIINDAQECVKLLVRIYEDGDTKVGWNEVRLALRNL